MALLPTSGRAQALEPAIGAHLDALAATLCDGAGSFRADHLHAADLTGDGQSDLVVDLHGLACAPDGSNPMCAAEACRVQIYVMEGGLLTLRHESDAQLLLVEEVTSPVVVLLAPGSVELRLSWTGTSFRAPRHE